MDIGISGIASAPGNFIGSSMRHAFDVPTFGQMSDRYNARDEYRNPDEYSNVERTGAALGVTSATALTGLGAAKGAQRFLPQLGQLRDAGQLTTRVPILGRGVPLPAPKVIGVAAGAAAIAGIGATGVVKTAQILNDDGNWGALGMGAGLVGGGLAGARLVSAFAPTRAPIGALVGMTAGAVAGKLAGNHVTAGLDGNLGERIPTEKNVDADLTDRAGSFAQGAWNHFSEVGPMSQGSSGALTWGMNDHFKEDYSNSERAGAMHGELAAAGILGGAAVGVGAVVKSVADRKAELAKLALTDPAAAAAAAPPDTALRAAAGRAMKVTGVGKLHEMATAAAPMVLTEAAGSKAHVVKAVAAGAAATAATAYTALHEAQTWGNGDIDSRGGIIAGGVVAGTTVAGGLGIAAARGGGRIAAPAAAGGMLAMAALIGVASAARQPLQQFHRDQKAAHGLEPGTDKATAIAAGTVLGAGGAYGGQKVAARLVPKDGFKIPKTPIHVPHVGGRVLGGVIGAAGAAYIGYGLSSTMPSIDKVGIAAGAGAAIGGVGALALRGAPGATIAKKVAIGATAGATLGMTASALAKDDAAK